MNSKILCLMVVLFPLECTFALTYLVALSACFYQQQCPWLVHLAAKLLQSDPITAELLAPGGNPFASTSATRADLAVPPVLRFVRAELYEVWYITYNDLHCFLLIWLVLHQLIFLETFIKYAVWVSKLGWNAEQTVSSKRMGSWHVVEATACSIIHACSRTWQWFSE